MTSCAFYWLRKPLFSTALLSFLFFSSPDNEKLIMSPGRLRETFCVTVALLATCCLFHDAAASVWPEHTSTILRSTD